MVPPKKFKTGKYDVHANIEAELKAIGDHFGLVPTVLLTEMYIATINENIIRFGAPDEIKERWCKFISIRENEKKEALKRERELKRNSEKSGVQKRILDEEKDKFIEWLYNDLFPNFSPDELNHYIISVKDTSEYKVRYAITSILKRYNDKTGSGVTLSKSNEIVLINHLIGLGGN